MSEIKERITVSTFVERYSKLNNDQLKDKYVKEHVKITYAPILKKKIILEAMNDKSIIEGSTGKYIDMITSKLNFTMAVLMLYTDIEPDKNEEGQLLVCESYDSLQSTGLIGKILNTIGSDIEELMNIQSQVMDTWYAQHTSTEAYIANLVEKASHKLGVYAGVGMDKVADVLSDEKKVNKIAAALDKLIKKIK